MTVYHIGTPKTIPPSAPPPPLLSPTENDFPTHFRALTIATVLFRLKQGVSQAQLATWSQLATDMVGKIPGQFPSPILEL